MIKYYFSAYALTKEFDLNAIAQSFHINKKYKWEDYLTLNSDQLEDILGDSEDKFVHIYSFGSIVFINFSAGEMTTFIKLMEDNFNSTTNPFSLKYIDEYQLDIVDNAELEVSNDHAVIPAANSKYIDIISLVLARSVALDKIEEGISKVTDKVEDIINYLETGKLNVRDKSLSKLIAEILGFKYTTISYIMILDKPDITWDYIDIDDFYYKLVELFELDDRFDQMKNKLGMLMDITEVFTTLMHENRSTRLEWMIIILIAIEIIIYLFELALK